MGVTVLEFQNALCWLRGQPPHVFVTLLKSGQMHIQATDEGKQEIVINLMKSYRSSVMPKVKPEKATTKTVAVVSPTLPKNNNKSVLIDQLRSIYRPFAQEIVRRGLTTCGVAALLRSPIIMGASAIAPPTASTPRPVTPTASTAPEPVKVDLTIELELHTLDRGKCPYCRTSLWELAAEHVEEPDKIFECPRCCTPLCFGSAEDGPFLAVALHGDTDDVGDFGDHDLEDPDAMVAFNQYNDDDDELQRHDAVVIKVPGEDAAIKGWLVADPYILKNSRSRKDIVYQYKVCLDVMETVTRTFPQATTGTPTRARDPKVVATRDPERQPLRAQQRKEGYFMLAHYHGSSLKHRYQMLTSVQDDTVLAKGFNTRILGRDMKTLAPTGKLNDQVMTFYLDMLVKRTSTKRRAIEHLGTYFDVKLCNKDEFGKVAASGRFERPMRKKDYKKYTSMINYKGIQRWTQRMDIFRRRIVLIPIHDPVMKHWWLLELRIEPVHNAPKNRPKHKVTLWYHESLTGGFYKRQKLKQYQAWVQIEYYHCYGMFLGKIECQSASSCKQENDYDCGVFVLVNAFCSCYGINPHNFSSQSKIDEFRVHIANSIDRVDIMGLFQYLPYGLNRHMRAAGV